MDQLLTYPEGSPFIGKVGETLADSVPAWPIPPRAAAKAPNILMIVLDDVGYGHFGCFGSPMDTPNLDALAKGGLQYTRYHTTAMCSPTRACLLTGRNHHTCGMGGIADLAMGFPGFHARIPKSCAFVSEVLRQNGYSTFAVGKWHLAPADELHAGAPRDRWPLGQGFERYFGFIGAETNQYAPDLVMDNTLLHSVEHREGYHFSEDMVDKAIGMINDMRVGEPVKPFFMYMAFGACHSPHQAPREYIDAYKGKFDDGWDAYRERVLARQKELGVMPPSTLLNERPVWVPAWDSCPPEDRRVYARMMEVYAGMLTHTDHQIGRVVEFLKSTGEFDNTLIMVSSDNGASSEGGVHGTFNENFVFNGLPHDKARTFELIDELGGPDSHAHYAWGWAMAGNTPFKRWKRETHEGGVGDPLLVSWPARIAASAGQLRHGYVHAVDLGATVLAAAGIELPDTVNGITQEPLAGASIMPSFDAANHPGRSTQYYEQFACRAIYHEGWKAVTFHPQLKYVETDDPDAPYSQDVWELYNVAIDPAETNDLAATEPARLEMMKQLWWDEAWKYGALPLQARRSVATKRPPGPIGDTVHLRQGAAPLPEANAPFLHRRNTRLVADVTCDDNDEGVLIAAGGRFAGFSLYVQDGHACFTYNYLGVDEHTVRAPMPKGRHVVTAEIRLTETDPQVAAAARANPRVAGPSDISILIDGKSLATVHMERSLPVRFSLAGEGICCGYDDCTPATTNYLGEFRYTNVIHRAMIDVSGREQRDLEAEFEAAWAAQ